MTRLPNNPNLKYLKKQAKVLLKGFRAHQPEAMARFRASLPRFASANDEVLLRAKISLQEAQLVIAREYGFDHWQKLALYAEPTASPRTHQRLITPREWAKNKTYVDQATGQLATTNEVWLLLTASHDGDVDTVRSLLDDKPELVDASYNYTPPIHFAVREGHVELSELLVERGANLGYRSYHFDDSLLQMAKDRGHEAIAALIEKRLIEKFPVSPHADNILTAIRGGTDDDVFRQLDADPALVHARNDTGESALHVACCEGKTDLVRRLIERGADVNVERADGFKPIHSALVRNGWGLADPREMANRFSIAGYLLEKGTELNIYLAVVMGDRAAVQQYLEEDPANANFLDSHHYRPISAALFRRDGDIARLLLAHGCDPSLPEDGAPRGLALWLAARSGDVPMARLLLEHGADPNAVVESSGSVTWAAGDDTEMRELLIEHGGKDELMLFEAAVIDGNVETVARLLKENPEQAANPDVMWGEGALSMAANRKNWDLIRLLMNHGSTVPDSTKWARSYYFKHYDVAKFLLEHGMNPNHRNWHRLTLLHDLAHDGEVDKIALLLDHGAEIDAIDDEYRSTPLGLAARAGQRAAVELLLNRGANATLAGADWATPVTWARRYGHNGIAQRIEKATECQARLA